MATARTNENNEIVLTMSREEAMSLNDYLGVHSISSSVNTYDVFHVLWEELGMYPFPAESLATMARVRLTDNNLVEIAPE